MDTDQPGIYFINTNTHAIHQTFLDVVGLERNQTMTGWFRYHQDLIAPDGSMGIFSLTFFGVRLPLQPCRSRLCDNRRQHASA